MIDAVGRTVREVRELLARIKARADAVDMSAEIKARQRRLALLMKIFAGVLVVSLVVAGVLVGIGRLNFLWGASIAVGALLAWVIASVVTFMRGQRDLFREMAKRQRSRRARHSAVPAQHWCRRVRHSATDPVEHRREPRLDGAPQQRSVEAHHQVGGIGGNRRVGREGGSAPSPPGSPPAAPCPPRRPGRIRRRPRRVRGSRRSRHRRCDTASCWPRGRAWRPASVVRAAVSAGSRRRPWRSRSVLAFSADSAYNRALSMASAACVANASSDVTVVVDRSTAALASVEVQHTNHPVSRQTRRRTKRHHPQGHAQDVADARCDRASVGSGERCGQVRR